MSDATDPRPSPLMPLPTELRQHNLRNLLWQSTTLRKADTEETDRYSTSDRYSIHERNFSFCPAVLRTCRLLHTEGQSILYDNIIACDIRFIKVDSSSVNRQSEYGLRLMSVYSGVLTNKSINSDGPCYPRSDPFKPDPRYQKA